MPFRGPRAVTPVLVVSLAVLPLARCACPTPEPPPLRGVDVGTVVGEALVDLGNGPESIDGAVVTVLGLPIEETTEAAKKFVLEAVPLGTHDITIRHDELERAVRFKVSVEAPFQTVILDEETTTLARAAALSGAVEVADPTLARVYLIGGGPDDVATPGDNGAFVLDGLPVGAAQIAVSAPGFETVISEVTLVEGDNTLDAVALAPSAVDNLTLFGQVQLVGQIDHRGIAVRLNDGEQVASTDENGQFTFSGLSPQLYNLKASRPGFRTVELATIALDSSGQAFGIVPMFLTPGEDVDDVDIPPPPVVDAGPGALDVLVVDIESPQAGTTILEGDLTILQAEVGGNVAVDPDDIVWSVRQNGSGDPAVEIGRGDVLTTTELPIGTIDILVDVAGGGLTAQDSVTVIVSPVELLPVFSAEVSVAIGGAGIVVPNIALFADRAELTIAQTQPVLLSATFTHPTEGDISERAEWVSDTGILITGRIADLAVLPPGTHDFTISVEDLAGRVGSSRVIVTVNPFAFTLTVNAPGLDSGANPPPPYFVEQGLPFSVRVNHPYQTAFAATAVKWFDIDNRQVANGLSGRTFALNEQNTSMRCEVTDIFGNVAIATAQFVLQSIDFSVSILAPTEGTDVLESTPITASVAVTHSLVPSQIPQSALQVRWLSSIQGLLTADDGRSSFAVTDNPTFSSLVPGLHRLTASVSDGSTLATATRQVRIRSPGVSATLTAPTDGTVFFANQAVSFTSIVNIDAQVASRLRITWKIDGQEFDPAWDDYGTNPANPARATINLGAYTPSAGLFADARLAPGRHTIELFARLDDVGDVCADIPSRAECVRFTIELVDQNVDLCPTTNVDRTITAAETWSGVRRLNCRVLISSTVTVEPGARIIVDAVAGNSGARRIQLNNNGQLFIGDIDAIEPVVFEVQGNLANVAAWDGFGLSIPGGGTGTVIVENTVIRHTDDTFDDFNNWDGPLTTLELRNVRAEKVNRFWRTLCPDVVDGLVIDNTGAATSVEVIAEATFRGDCRVPRAYRNVTLKNVGEGIDVVMAGTLTLDSWTVEDVRTNATQMLNPGGGFSTQDFLLHVKNSTFRRVGLGQNGRALQTDACGRIRVENSLFDNNNVALDDGDSFDCELYTNPLERIVATNNVFLNNQIAVEVEARGGTPPVELHANSFIGNSVHIAALNDGADVNAQGNFLGAAGDFTNPAGVLRSLPAGRVTNLPKISDVFDNPNNERVVHIDNPLNVAATVPSGTAATFLTAPRQAEHIPVGGCVPVRVASGLGDLDEVATCDIFVESGGVRSAASIDANGCLVASLAAGEHAVIAECTVNATSVVEEHRGRFLIDAARRSGATRPGVETWSGIIELDGDVTVPAGSTLIISAGTTVRVATSDRLRGERVPNHPDGPGGENTGVDDDGNFGPNKGFGDRNLIDIFVDGNLVVDGTANAPVRFESITGVSLAGQWGGIRVAKLGTAALNFAEIDSTVVALHGELVPIDPASAPQLEIFNSTITSSTHGLRGVCPIATGFSDNTMIDVFFPMSQVHCQEALVISRSRFERIGDPAVSTSDAFDVGTYAAGGPANVIVTFENSELLRSFGSRADSAFRQRDNSAVSFFLVRDSVVDGFNFMNEMFEQNTVLRVERTRWSRFTQAFQRNSQQPASLQIVRSILDDGDQILDPNAQPQEVIVTDTRFVNVDNPLDDVDIDIVTTMQITGNQFENAVNVFVLDMFSPQNNAVFSIDLSGNNFIGTTGDVVRFRQGNTFFTGGAFTRNVTANLDFTNSHFGAAVTAPAIEALLEDPQIDASAADTIKGRSDYTGFSTTPVPLNLLP